MPDGVELARWAFTVCRNLWIDEYRSRKIRRNVDVEPEVYEAGQVDGESDVHSQMELERVMAAIKHLPEDQQTVLTMVAIQGLPYQQVADELEIPIGTVMSRLSRARARLASSLQLTN